jgi:hypothetical protein
MYGYNYPEDISWLLIWPIHPLQMYSDASKVILIPIKSFWCFPMYMIKVDNTCNLKTHTYTSQAIIMWLHPCNQLSMYQSLEISVCPLCNLPLHVPVYLIFDILIPDHYLISLPSHCLAHCLSIARYSFMYLICVTYTHHITYLFPFQSFSKSLHPSYPLLTPTLSIKFMTTNNNCVPPFHICFV